MAVTNRTRKDSCEKARVLLLFVRHSRYRLTHVSRCTLGRPRPHTRTTLPLSKVWNISHQQGNQNLTWIAIQGHSRSCTSGSLKSRRGSIDILYKVSEQNMATEISENAEMYCRQPHCRIASPSRETPANIRIYLIFLENRIIGQHFAADTVGLPLLKFFYFCKSDLIAIQGHWFWHQSKECIRLVRLPARALLSQLGQLSLPSLWGR